MKQTLFNAWELTCLEVALRSYMKEAGQVETISGDALLRKVIALDPTDRPRETREPAKLMVPSVHLNGTSREELRQLNLDAICALQAAVEALAKACPHGRDYYVQGPDATAAARGQHEKRMHRLADNIHELNQIAEAIADAPGRR